MSVDEISRHLGIFGLADICARMRALDLDLFAELGTWVTESDAGQSQRWYSSACHRHAWHAELWAERSPLIPGVDLETAVADLRAERLPHDPDEQAYRRILAELLADLDSIAARFDGELDPGTRRVITIIHDDVTDLINT